MTPLIVGLAGPVLTPRERTLLPRLDPAGIILFGRNCADPAQLRGLTDSLRDLLGRDLAILIDQEGGRVARLAPPHWPAFPAPAVFGAAYARAPITAISAARANAAALAQLLRAAGININCLPLLDVAAPDAHPVIGDRSFGAAPQAVAALGRAVLDGLRDGGVAGVVKHVPGHGRARADSHAALPVVDADRAALERDIAPFRALAATAPIAMTAHILYPALDGANCASASPRIIADLVRRDIGFAGLLLSDDIGMAGLAAALGDAPVAARGAAVLRAGCDLALYGADDLDGALALAGAVGDIGAAAAARLAAALAWAVPPAAAPDLGALLATRDRLLAA